MTNLCQAGRKFSRDAPESDGCSVPLKNAVRLPLAGAERPMDRRRMKRISRVSTPHRLHNPVNGLFILSWIHEAPSSTGTPRPRAVQIRPPMRGRASRTETDTPASCKRRAAASPAIPAPITMTERAPTILRMALESNVVQRRPSRLRGWQRKRQWFRYSPKEHAPAGSRWLVYSSKLQTKRIQPKVRNIVRSSHPL